MAESELRSKLFSSIMEFATMVANGVSDDEDRTLVLDAVLADCREAAKEAIDEPVETGDQYGSCVVRSPYADDHKRALDRKLR